MFAVVCACERICTVAQYKHVSTVVAAVIV